MYTSVWTGIVLIMVGISSVYYSGRMYRRIEKRDYKDDLANEKLDRTFSGGIFAVGFMFIFIGILFLLKNA